MTVWERLSCAGENTPRLLVVTAHPDDETLALGGRMEWLSQSRFVTVTDGVPLDGMDAQAHGFKDLAEYGKARRAELNAALRMAGLNSGCASGLRLESGKTVPDQRAAHMLVEITRALVREIKAFNPEAILTHPYEGGHPDHDACAFAVWAAARLSGFAAAVIEATFYHAGEKSIETGVFLSGDQGIDSRLTPEQSERKRSRLACFVSQTETLSLFGVEMERFREAPAYDFSRRPTNAQMYYERFPWGMDGDGFCRLVLEARRELGL